MIGKMTRYSMTYRIYGLAVSAALLLGCAPAEAVGDGVQVTCDEAYYATTDYYGNLNEGGVVKSYTMNGIPTLCDYGSYDEVINLTDASVPVTKEGTVRFDFSGAAVPEHFYFEGKTAAPFRRLPWTLSVRYTLNGAAARAEELAGKTGVVEILVDAIPNGLASAYASNNYTLEIAAVFNQDDILSLSAPGAQVQLLGNLRTVLFLALPGEEGHYSIRVGSNDFSFGGLTIMMIPATLSQLDLLSELSERKGRIEENYDLLSGSLDTLLSSMGSISGSLYDTAEGLDRLTRAEKTISEGKDALYQSADAALAGLDALNDSLEPLNGHLDGAQQVTDDTVEALDRVSGSVRELQKLLTEIRDDLKLLRSALKKVADASDEAASDMDALNTAVDRLYSDRSKLLPLLTELRLGVGSEELTVQGMTAEQLSGTLARAETLHGIYRSVGSGGTLTEQQFLTAALLAKGKTAQEAQTLLTQVQSIGDGIAAAVGAGMPQENAKQYVYAQAGMDSTQIAAYETGAASVATLRSVYAAFSGGDTMNEEEFFSALIYANGGGSVSAAQAETQGAQLITLLDRTASLKSRALSLREKLGTDGLTEHTAELLDNAAKLLNRTFDLTGTADNVLDETDALLDAAEELNGITDANAPKLKAALTEMKSTVTALRGTVSDTHGFLSSLEALLKSADRDLDEGTRKTLEGLSASLRATADSLNTTEDVKAAKQNISSVLEDTWNEYTGDSSNILLMDSSAVPVSLTDSRNSAPQSIQVLIRTQEIKTADAQKETQDAQEGTHTTFMQRVAQMLRDLWSFLCGIFSRKG